MALMKQKAKVVNHFSQAANGFIFTDGEKFVLIRTDNSQQISNEPVTIVGKIPAMPVTDLMVVNYQVFTGDKKSDLPYNFEAHPAEQVENEKIVFWDEIAEANRVHVYVTKLNQITLTEPVAKFMSIESAAKNEFLRKTLENEPDKVLAVPIKRMMGMLEMTRTNSTGRVKGRIIRWMNEFFAADKGYVINVPADLQKDLKALVGKNTNLINEILENFKEAGYEVENNAVQIPSEMKYQLEAIKPKHNKSANPDYDEEE